ncbi:MAG: hypothetical protein GYB64_03205 [Chloroflexi bacterium]|nr:hypothetical protein [Chloroflexota bacterium]
MDREEFIEKYIDVLQNLEAAIAEIYGEIPRMTDASVDRALNALIRTYTAEMIGKPVTLMRLDPHEQRLYDRLKEVSDWRLGKGEGIKNEQGELVVISPSGIKTTEEIVECLNHVRRSVGFWSRKAGRQGYLKFISKYV